MLVSLEHIWNKRNTPKPYLWPEKTCLLGNYIVKNPKGVGPGRSFRLQLSSTNRDASFEHGDYGAACSKCWSEYSH